nr:SIR2 family protein [Prevotella sp.]
MKTFLFAAGASIPFFDPALYTNYLTETVKDINSWKLVIEKYKNTLEGAVIPDAQKIFNIITCICKNYRNTDANFEQIAEIIDKLASYGYSMGEKDLDIFVKTLLTISGKDNITPNVELAHVPFLFREIIAGAILDLQENHKSKSYDDLIKKQKELLEYINIHDTEINLISLNYDDCLIESCEGLGFENCFNKRKLDIGKFVKCKKVIYFPHGQLRFQYTNDTNDNNIDSNVILWDDSSTADKKRWYGLDDIAVKNTCQLTKGGFAYNYNTFITTGQTKNDCFNILPYSVYYERMATDFASSDTIYIIGYSFGDQHINRLLNTFLERNENNKIFIIDYSKEKYSAQTILETFNTFNPDGVYLYNQNEVNESKEEKHNVIYYNKGYEEFLNEFDKVLKANF